MEFYRICIVGIIATILDAIVFYIVRKFAIYQVALIRGFFISLVVNYSLRYYGRGKKKPSKNALSYLIVYILFLCE